MVPVGEGRRIGPHRLRIRALRLLPGQVSLNILIINREETLNFCLKKDREFLLEIRVLSCGPALYN